MMTRRLVVLLVFLAMLGVNTMGVAQVRAETVTLRLRSDQETLINKNNLDQIKQFILQQGKRCTYSNRYNNNPCHELGPYIYYLNPDPGGPDNHPQWNINSDPKMGDFNTLVIRRNLSVDRSDKAFEDQYRHIDFKKEYDIQVEADNADSRWPIAQVREFPEAAIQLLLNFIAEKGKR